MTTIDTNAFSDNKIKKVIIPASVTSIGESPFMGNNTLEEIVVDENNPTYDSRNNCNAIIETSTNTLIQGCKTTTIPNTITNINRAAFTDMSLTSMIIPDSVATIGHFAFQSNQLTSISLPDSVTTIESYAFSSNQLASVTLGNSITIIGDNAFQNNKLTNLIIPNSVTEIGREAFSSSNETHTNSNTGITYVDNPNLKTIYYNGSNQLPWIYAVNGNSSEKYNKFVTGTVPSRTVGSTIYNEVLITTGK